MFGFLTLVWHPSKAGANSTILVFNPAIHDAVSDYAALEDEEDGEGLEEKADKPRTGGGFGGVDYANIEVNDGDGGRGKDDDPSIHESRGALDDLQAELAA